MDFHEILLSEYECNIPRPNPPLQRPLIPVARQLSKRDKGYIKLLNDELSKYTKLEIQEKLMVEAKLGRTSWMFFRYDGPTVHDFTLLKEALDPVLHEILGRHFYLRITDSGWDGDFMPKNPEFYISFVTNRST